MNNDVITVGLCFAAFIVLFAFFSKLAIGLYLIAALINLYFLLQDQKDSKVNEQDYQRRLVFGVLFPGINILVVLLTILAEVQHIVYNTQNKNES